MDKNNPIQNELFKKGYVYLPIGSYRRWILKNWHELFVYKKLITRNAYGQFVPLRDTLRDFMYWDNLYNQFERARDNVPKGSLLTPEEAAAIKQENLFDGIEQLTLITTDTQPEITL